MATDTESGHLGPRAASAAVTARSGKSARQSRAAARSHRTALLLIGLGFLRSRLIVQAAIVGAIRVVALAGLAQENQAKNRARLAAWYKAQSERLERSIKST